VTVFEQARRATKKSFLAMMDAASKTANLHTLCAEAATDPNERENHRTAASQWLKSAAQAMEFARQFSTGEPE
jgi:hypothetical protein